MVERVEFELLVRPAEGQHQRVGAVGGGNSAFARLLFGLNLRPALRIKFIKKPGKLPDARLVRQPFNLVALERIGESLVELGSQIYKRRAGSSSPSRGLLSHGIPTLTGSTGKRQSRRWGAKL